MDILNKMFIHILMVRKVKNAEKDKLIFLVKILEMT